MYVQKVSTNPVHDLAGWQWKNFRQLNHPSFWVCSKGCKSGCGANLEGYSHCNLATDVNHNGLPSIDMADSTNMENGCRNATSNAMISPNGLVMNGQQHGKSIGCNEWMSLETPVMNDVSKCPYK